MHYQRLELVLSGSAGSAAGSVSTSRPVTGEVVAVHIDPNGQPNSLDLTIKGLGRGTPERTLLTLTNYAGGTATYNVGQPLYDEAGTVVTYDGTREVHTAVPINDYVQVVGGGGDAGTMTVTVVYR